MCPQSGDAAAGSTPTRNGVPGPAHITCSPSPMRHTTDVGRAVAVTDTPGTAAVAVTGAQPPSSHNQVGKFTNCSPAGFTAITGTAGRSCRRASCAKSAAVGPPAPAAAGASGIHTGARYTESR